VLLSASSVGFLFFMASVIFVIHLGEELLLPFHEIKVLAL
jgi:hypothetical protein